MLSSSLEMRMIAMHAPQWALKINWLRLIFINSKTPYILIIGNYSNLHIPPLAFWSLANTFIREEGIQAMISICSQINLFLPDWRVSSIHPCIHHPSTQPSCIYWALAMCCHCAMHKGCEHHGHGFSETSEYVEVAELNLAVLGYFMSSLNPRKS